MSSLKVKLSLREGYLNSNIFDGFNYTGSGVSTDDQVLPPSLYGYAPDVSGMAYSNAKVTISQMNRALHETQVLTGSFRIQDIGDSVSGILHVHVEEQNGQAQEYDVMTTSMPLFMRRGQVCHKVTIGCPEDWNHKAGGDLFPGRETSQGVADGWSFYGDTSADKHYQSAAMGVGRDPAQFSALAFNMIRSYANLGHDNVYGKGKPDGNSPHVSYAKDFGEPNNRVTFVGYHFSGKNFMTISEYLDANQSDMARTGNDREMHMIACNQNFAATDVPVYSNYSHRTYWDHPEQTNYNLMFSYYFNMGSIRNMSILVIGYRHEYDDNTDKRIYLSMSIPWSDSSTVTYSGSYGGGSSSSQVGCSKRVDDAAHYQVDVDTNEQRGSADGYLSHGGLLAKIDLSINYHEGEYRSAGITLQGGATLTAYSRALHHIQSMGDTRLLIGADRIANVPVKSSDALMYTNMFGKAMITDISNYYRNQMYIDLNDLPEDAEATQSVMQATLTEGAISYCKFKVTSGQKAMAVLQSCDDSYPSFGVGVKNDKQRQAGIVDDGGNVYLTEINAGEHMIVSWEDSVQCEIVLPKSPPAGLFSDPLLPCE